MSNSVAWASGTRKAPVTPWMMRNATISVRLCAIAHSKEAMVKPITDDDQQALAADAVGQPAGDRDRDRRGDDVAGQHPVDAFLGRAEARLHVRQRDVGDGRVEHLDQHREHHRDGDQRAPAVGSSCCSRRHRGRLTACRRCGRRPWPTGRRSSARPGFSSNAMRTGTRWVTLTQLPLAFCAGRTENSLPVPAPIDATWPFELEPRISVEA